MDTSAFRVWHLLARQVKQMVPQLHGHRAKTLALLVLGVVLAKSILSAKVAEHMRRLLGTRASSQERTWGRFLANEAIEPEMLWRGFLPSLLAGWAYQRELTFVVDTTLLGDRVIVVSFGLLCHSRVWPLGWRVMPGKEAWEQGQYAIIAQMMAAVQPYVSHAQCRLLADSGLTRYRLVTLCEQMGWHYLLRLEMDRNQCALCTQEGTELVWQPVSALVPAPGAYWAGRVWLWKTHQHPCWLTATWQQGQDAPLVVLSDEGAGRGYLCRYRARMRIEATFEDQKSRGFELHHTHVRDRAHLERLLLLLALAIWWLARLGGSCIHHGQRTRFDRTDRRDKSVLRLGHLWVQEILDHGPTAATLARCLPFHRHGTGWRLCLRF